MQSTTCPPIQSVSESYLAELIAKISTGKFTDGPAILYDDQRRILLTAVVLNGAIESWMMTSCESYEEAEREVTTTRKIAQVLMAVNESSEQTAAILSGLIKPPTAH